MLHENSWNNFLKHCALQNPNSNLSKRDDGQRHIMEQMSGLQFRGHSQASRSNETSYRSPLDDNSGYRLQHITDTFISAIENVATLSSESFIPVIFKEIFGELERQALCSLVFDEKSTVFDFRETELEVRISYDTFLVVHCIDMKQMTVRLCKRIKTGTDNTLGNKNAETASSVRCRIPSLSLKRILSGITSDEIQSKINCWRISIHLNIPSNVGPSSRWNLSNGFSRIPLLLTCILQSANVRLSVRD